MSRPRWPRPAAGSWALLVCAISAAAGAAAPPTVVEEAVRVAQAAGRLAEEDAVRRLAPALGVSPQQVGDLRDQKLTFGDVAAALAIAQVAERSLHAVVALWANERLDWNEVATRLGAPRARVVRLLRGARQALAARPAR